ncbi:MAG: hypothetical protein KDK70_04925 [Myxococcales bacterium]|nr:hypothetical protein [Myxococcales bacterium]
MTLMDAAPAHAAAPEASAPADGKSSSWWLKHGETRQEAGDYAGAGEAYAKALDALSEQKQRANVGARTAMLSADAHWMAFEADGDIAHIRAGFEVLDRWITLAGPGSQASLLPRAERLAARYHSIHDPLQQGDAALADGDLERASKHHREALEALAVQRHPWPIGARVTLKLAQAHVDAYDRSVAGVDDIEPNRPKLVEAKELLEGWRGRRPSDDASAEGPALEALLAEVEARLAEGTEQLDAALAERERQAQLAAQQKAEQERQAQLAAQQDDSAEREQAARAQRRTGIILLSTGLVATAAGAGLLGEGLAFGPRSRQLAQDEQDQAQALTQMYGDAYARDEFDASLADYRERVRRRNTGLVAGGAVLAAGGLAATAVGVVWLVRARRAGTPGATARAWLAPAVSPTQAGLTLAGRFR